MLQLQAPSVQENSAASVATPGAAGSAAAWEGTSVAYPAVAAHQQFEAQAARRPHAIAVVFAGQELAYDELNDRANQLARYLVDRGVVAETRVAVGLPPSLEIVVCLLAILKAGGVYVPIDPNDPADRITDVLADCRPVVILTKSVSLEKFRSFRAERIFCLDRDLQQTADFSAQNLELETSSERTAYLIYTSGTTGRPKGVMASQGNLVHYLGSARETYGYHDGDTIPALARFTFSISLFELLSPLTVGGKLLLLEREHVLNFKRLAETLAKVTAIHASPSLWRRLLPYLEARPEAERTFPRLRHVSSGGDLVPSDLLEQMQEFFPMAEIFVIYGCTEVSCMGCTYPVPRVSRVTYALVGRPFTNVKVRLLDAALLPVPVGGQGEIYFAGAGVTKGYLNLPELTAERYLTICGERFYRTGDLGREVDGQLAICGRVDFQIQLRGIRIEPGEIEVALRQTPGVRDAVVIAGELGRSEKSVIAYIVLDDMNPPEVEFIREFIGKKLPDYMVPAAFIFLPSLPVNANLKVDRRALPAPHPGNLAGLKAVLLPRDEWEKEVVEIWENSLGVRPIGIQNTFLELGGDSLQAVQILLEIERRWRKELPLTALVGDSSVQTLAAMVRDFDAAAASSSHAKNVVTLRAGGGKPPLFCLHGVLLYQELAQCLDAAQPVYGVILQEEVELLKTRTHDPINSRFSSIPDIASHYLESIRSIQPRGPYYIAGASFGGIIAFEMGQQLRAAGEEVPLVAMFDSWMIKKIPLSRRIQFHWNWFMKHGVGYLANRVWHRAEVMGRRLLTAGSRFNKQLCPGSAAAAQIFSLEDLEQLIDEVSAVIERSYVPKPYPGKLVLFRAMDQGFFSENSPDLGWNAFAEGELEVFDIPGDHKGILRGVSAAIMAQRLQSYLG